MTIHKLKKLIIDLVSMPISQSVFKSAGFETVLLTLLMPLLGSIIGANDPFYLSFRFPWLILVPLLISLRYGFLFSMGSTSSMIAVFVIGRYFQWEAIPFFPAETVVGMLLVTLISAGFQGKWEKRVQLLQNESHYLNLRMDMFSRTYHTLKGSHSLLERQLANQFTSLRTSLHDLDRQVQLLEKQEGTPLKSIGESILTLFSEYGSIQTASLYGVADGQKLSLHPIACLGKSPSCWPSSQLVREAFKTGCVTSIKNSEGEMGQDILVVIPLLDVYQKIWGMVIVNEMPLFALQENTLDLLSLLGGQIGDLIQRRTEAASLAKDEWPKIENELLRIFRDTHLLKIDTALVISIVNSIPAFDALMSKFQIERRGLDKLLAFKDEFGRQIIITLLPMTNEQGLKTFLARLDLTKFIVSENSDVTGLGELPEVSVAHDGVSIYGWVLNDANSPEKTLAKIAQLCCRKYPTTRLLGFSHAEISA